MEVIGQLLLAALWGGFVGAEREYRSKSAGFRTMILISTGSCLFTILSFWIGTGSSPDRIASNIVTGIGFLGAGAIFRDENRVNGITTAATIWAVAAVGMAIGSGRYTAAGVSSVLIILVLAALPAFERQIDRLNIFRQYNLTCEYSEEMRVHFESILKKSGLRYKLINQSKIGDELSFTWQTQGSGAKHEKFSELVIHDEAVKKFFY